MPSNKVEAKLAKLAEVFADIPDEDLAKIFDKASQRAKEHGLPYATLEKVIVGYNNLKQDPECL